MILARAALLGANSEEMVERFRVPREQLALDEGRIPASVMLNLWEEVPRVVQDPAFGLHLGEETAADHLALLARLFDACSTLGEALVKLVDLQRIVNDIQPAVVVRRDDLTAIQLETKDSPWSAPRHAFEFGFAFVVVLARRATGADLSPSRVRFEHPRPQDTTAHARIFRCPIEFASGSSEIEFPTSMLQIPHKTADPALSRILETYAREVAGRLPQSASYVVRVKEAIVRHLEEGPTIHDVARRLHASERSVQRYLAKEETTFADVLDDVRRTLAESALRDGSASIAQVSQALGYSDQSAFHKAFVRWTGKTPGAFRGSRG